MTGEGLAVAVSLADHPEPTTLPQKTQLKATLSPNPSKKRGLHPALVASTHTVLVRASVAVINIITKSNVGRKG